MKPTTTIGLCAVMQIVVIAGAWLLTRSSRKIYEAAWEQSGLPEPSLGLMSSLFASYGWLLLILPLLFLVLRLQCMKTESRIGASPVLGFWLCIGVTVLLFGFCALMTSRMLSAAWDQREMPLEPLKTLR